MSNALTGQLRRLKSVVRKSPLVWRYYHNMRPSLGYLRSRPTLEQEGRRVLADLNRDGIAVTDVESLLGAPGLELFEAIRREIAQADVNDAASIAEARIKAQNPDDEKAFNYSYIVGKRQLEGSDPFLKFALLPQTLNLANRYFGMFTRLRYCNIWRTFATSAPARDSQLWHRDRDDHLTVKMFMYLQDVDEGAGPFTYAKQTHPKGSVKQEPAGTPERPGGPLRTTDEEMAQVVPTTQWHKAVGKAGSIIFADTRGFHCGGRAKTQDRLMYIAMYVSTATPPPANDHIAPSPQEFSLPQQRFALFGK